MHGQQNIKIAYVIQCVCFLLEFPKVYIALKSTYTRLRAGND